MKGYSDISPVLLIHKKCTIVTIAEKLKMKINNLKEQKHGFKIHILSEKGFMGTVVNRALPLCGGSLEIRLTAPFKY